MKLLIWSICLILAAILAVALIELLQLLRHDLLYVNIIVSVIFSFSVAYFAAQFFVRKLNV
ncbi:hypothetical protein [Fangia hongkongensis]|uniref:hypothetical protein n=1 Tax=Fangia hongkongensis TaxID=270495 RepID=UPI00035E2838|nr:hypothetical protein [Fangia hongkongensis]MBK2124851.1 hypothetical protein [Fangia hongkongensis]